MSLLSAAAPADPSTQEAIGGAIVFFGLVGIVVWVLYKGWRDRQTYVAPTTTGRVDVEPCEQPEKPETRNVDPSAPRVDLRHWSQLDAGTHPCGSHQLTLLEEPTENREGYVSKSLRLSPMIAGTETVDLGDYDSSVRYVTEAEVWVSQDHRFVVVQTQMLVLVFDLVDQQQLRMQLDDDQFYIDEVQLQESKIGVISSDRADRQPSILWLPISEGLPKPAYCQGHFYGTIH